MPPQLPTHAAPHPGNTRLWLAVCHTQSLTWGVGHESNVAGAVGIILQALHHARRRARALRPLEVDIAQAPPRAAAPAVGCSSSFELQGAGPTGGRMPPRRPNSRRCAHTDTLAPVPHGDAPRAVAAAHAGHAARQAAQRPALPDARPLDRHAAARPRAGGLPKLEPCSSELCVVRGQHEQALAQFSGSAVAQHSSTR